MYFHGHEVIGIYDHSYINSFQIMNNVVNSIILNIEKRDRNFLFQIFIVIFFIRTRSIKIRH